MDLQPGIDPMRSIFRDMFSREADQSEIDSMTTFLGHANANTARLERGALPVMRARLQDRMSIARGHVFEAANASELRKPAGGCIMRNTMLAPITHGIAPPIEALSPILLAEAITAVNKIHTGRVMYLKSVGTAFRLVAVSVLAEDASGDRMVLQLYNYVRADEDPREIFPPGTRLAMLEPYLRFPRDDPANPVCMRCDNPQAVRVFPAEPSLLLRAQRGEFWEEPSADALCEQGNRHFAAGRFEKAARLYTDAVRSASIEGAPAITTRAMANRAACYLRQNCWGAALQDASDVLAWDAQHKKAAFRKAEALLLLQRPEEARSAAQLAAALLGPEDKVPIDPEITGGYP